MTDNNMDQNLNFDKPFSDREKMVVQKKSPLKKLLSTLVMLIVIGGIGMVGYYAYKESSEPVDLSKLNTIQADSDPIKAQPLEPDGEPVANMDKKVYEAISPENQANQAAPKDSDTLPGYEEPINRDLLKEKIESLKNDQAQGNAQDILPKQTPEEKVAAVQEQVKSEVQTEVAPPAAAPVKKEAEIAKSAPAMEHKTAETKTAEPAKKKKAAVKPVTTKKASTSRVSAVPSTYKIQLGAYKTEQEARDAWTALLKKQGTLLGDLTALIHKADIKDKGTFYRLQAGTIKSETEAKKLCQTLTAAKQDCFVVKN